VTGAFAGTLTPNAVTPAGIAAIAALGAGPAAAAAPTGLNADGFPGIPPIRLGIATEEAAGRATSGSATFTFVADETMRVAGGGGATEAARLAACTRYSNWRVPSPEAGGAALKFSFRLA